MRECLRDQSLLEALREVLHDVLLTARQPAVGFARERSEPICGGLVAFLSKLGGKIADLDELSGGHYSQPVTDVFQLSHVACEIPGGQVGHRRIRQTLHLDAEFARGLGEEMPGQDWNVLASLADRRQPK